MHYLISLGLLNNSLLAAMSLRTLLFFPKHKQIISLSAMCALGMQGCISTQMQAKTTFPLSCPQASQGFFHIVPKGTSPKKVAEPLGSVQRPHRWHWSETNSLTPRSGTSQNLLLLNSIFGKCSREGRAWDGVDDSTPGDSTHKYEWEVWEKAAVCHHTFLISFWGEIRERSF